MIHSTAIIDPSANIADDVSIGAYAIIGKDVSIGSGSSIGHHTTISGPITIGKNNRIFQHVSLGEEPQDLSYQGESTQLTIGDNNVIREYVSMNRGTQKGGGLTCIGSDNFFMAYVHIGHDCSIGNHNIFTNATSLAGHVDIGNHCTLGGFSLVHQFTRIGSYAFSSMGAAINRDVPPFVIVSGNYASSYGINKVGLKRKGFNPDTIAAINKAYKLVVRQRTQREEGLTQLKTLQSTYPEVDMFVDFIQNSQRGIVK